MFTDQVIFLGEDPQRAAQEFADLRHQYSVQRHVVTGLNSYLGEKFRFPGGNICR